MGVEYKKLKECLNDDIKFTPEDVAELFCQLNCEGMANFFNEVCRVSDKWQGGFPMQMQYVCDSPSLENEGIKIMRLIGDYADA